MGETTPNAAGVDAEAMARDIAHRLRGRTYSADDASDYVLDVLREGWRMLGPIDPAVPAPVGAETDRERALEAALRDLLDYVAGREMAVVSPSPFERARALLAEGGES